MSTINLNEPYNGLIYVVRLGVEVYNLKKNSDKMNYPKGDRRLYVDKPTALGIAEIVARTNVLDEIRGVQNYVDRAARKVYGNYRSDMMVRLTKVLSYEVTNHSHEYKSKFNSRKAYEKDIDNAN